MPPRAQNAWLRTLGALAALLGAATLLGLAIGYVWPVLTVAARSGARESAARALAMTAATNSREQVLRLFLDLGDAGIADDNGEAFCAGNRDIDAIAVEQKGESARAILAET